MAPSTTNKPGFHGIHDVGFTGLEDLDASKLDTSTKQLAYWEKRTHATVFGLVKRRLMVVDELRRAIEALPPATYEAMTYYERWAAGASAVCMERGTFTRAEFDQELGVLPDPAQAEEPKYARFKAGDLVRVKDEQAAVLTRWRKPHLRTPGYLFGLVGLVERECQGVFGNPEALAFHESAPVTAMYRVRFAQRDVWEGYTDEHEKDTVDVEIYDAWLDPATPQDLEEQRVQSAKRRAIFTAHSAADCTPGGHAHTHDHDHAHDHDHEHGHDHEHEDHVHEEREQVEQAAVDKEGDEQERCRISDALTRVLVAKGILTNEELRANVEALDMLGEKANGARLVAHAWADPEFRKRLLTDAHAACDELGIAATAYPTKPADPNAQVPDVSSGPPPLTERHGTVLTVLENTDSVHNLIVCTLCSCYPVSVLGISPSWYKSRQYRALAIRKPRDVLRAFGTELPPGLQVAVHDSTADNRYMVLPQRPAGTEGWTEEQLQAIITRDMLIGVARPATPAAPPA